MTAIAWYQADIRDLLTASDNEIVGKLVGDNRPAATPQQISAWRTEISVLRDALSVVSQGTLFLELVISRMGKRADAVLLAHGLIFVIEFKVGAEAFDRAARDQVHDYALDLKNFHRGSHSLPIVPILVATAAAECAVQLPNWADDAVAAPLVASSGNLGALIQAIGASRALDPINVHTWVASGYQPTPTIVEAAQALYRGHRVEEIARSEAGAKNLSATAICIDRVIDDAKANSHKSICFVTGVPGSGETLAGLNIATRRAAAHAEELACPGFGGHRDRCHTGTGGR